VQPSVTVVNFDHFEQIRTAINAIRGAQNSPALTWRQMLEAAGFPNGIPVPDHNAGIYAAHILALRTAIDAALAAVQVPTSGYTDSLASPTPISTSHHAAPAAGAIAEEMLMTTSHAFFSLSSPPSRSSARWQLKSRGSSDTLSSFADNDSARLRGAVPASDQTDMRTAVDQAVFNLLTYHLTFTGPTPAHGGGIYAQMNQLRAAVK
jgi:hypothetical protein